MAHQGGFNSFLTLPGPNPSSSAHAWELHKSTIKELYVDRRQPLKDVMEIMEKSHNFRAS
jgi:hypothetical protein